MKEVIRSISGAFLAISLNTILNLTDAATYGRLIFPIHAPLFANYDYLGISMFLACTAISQLIISTFSSFRRGATGCAMVENIPLYHSICYSIATKVINEDAMISTILVCYATVSILTALLFCTLASLGLDRLVHKFPRVVLVGSMGGIGFFLLGTALDMAANDHFELGYFARLFSSFTVMALWMIGTFAALIALFIELKYKVPFVTPITSVIIFASFYFIVQFIPYSLSDLRELGWLMSGPSSSDSASEILSRLSLKFVDPVQVMKMTPYIVAAALLGSIHVPINVPSFSRLTNQSFSLKRELYTQSLSNFASSICGFIPSYFVYTNSLLFLKAGGTSRWSGILLAISTGASLIWGLQLIGYIPTLVILFLLFYLGLYLIFEAATAVNLCTSIEFVMIWSTIALMMKFGFVIGIGIGSLIALFYGLLTLSGSPPITESLDLHIPIKRPAIEALVQRCLPHCPIVKFHGSLGFISVTEEMQKLTFSNLQCKALIIDFHEVVSVDLNLREAFLGMIAAGLLSEKWIIVCGMNDEKLNKLLSNLPHVILTKEKPIEWLKGTIIAEIEGRGHHLQQQIDTIDEELDELLEKGEVRNLLNDEDASFYARQVAREEELFNQLNGIVEQIKLHPGEALSTHHSTDGILVIKRGKVRLGSRRYEEGAWVGLEEFLQGEEERLLNQVVAITPTTATLIPLETLKEALPTQSLNFNNPFN